MGIPILNELNGELTRLYIAGSPLAKGDPRLTRYIAPLQTLGAKAPVFAALAARLEALVAPDGEKASPQNLMETGMLLQSVLYTQGSTDIGETTPMAYASQPLTVPKTPYSRLWEMQEVLRTGSQAHTDAFRLAFEAGQHRDPRLYRSYVEAVTDNKSTLSDYVADTLLPSLGADIVPFLMERLDLAGGKRNARLLRVLHAIQGRETLPLAERALQEGSPPVVAAALYILADDPRYEDTLLAYSNDRKGELRQAAFTALTRLGSASGEAALLAALGKKASVTALEEALCESRSPAVAAAVLDQATACIKMYQDHAAKLKVLLRVLAAREEPAGLTWLEARLTDAGFYAEAVNTLDLGALMQRLSECNTPAKNELLLRISEGDDSRLHYKFLACVRLFDAREVYDRCHKDIRRGRGRNHYYYLSRAYGVDGAWRPDDQKTWDRRWSALLSATSGITAGYAFLYEDDADGWKHLLEAVAAQVKNQRRQSAFYGRILAHAFRAGYSGAHKYYDKFLKNGYPKEELIPFLGEYAPLK